jgi:hypothetical protein
MTPEDTLVSLIKTQSKANLQNIYKLLIMLLPFFKEEAVGM